MAEDVSSPPGNSESPDSQIAPEGQPPVETAEPNPMHQVAAAALALKSHGDSGANWFFWVAGLSLVNTIIAHSGGDRHFIVGLSFTAIVDAIAQEIGKQEPGAATAATLIAIGFSCFVTLVAALFGWMSRKRWLVAFGIGMAIYVVDGLLYLLLMFFFIPFSLIYFNRDAVTITELTYQRIENNQRSFFTVIVKTFENSSWIVNKGEKNSEPALIYSVYKRNNLLIINNELFEMNKPGFCRDGEDGKGKFKMCIREILPQLSMGAELSFDSVIVYEKRHEGLHSDVTLYYISATANLLVKKEKRDALGNLTASEVLSRVVNK